MAEKPKVAIYWLASCAGCDEAIVDLNEVILTVADAVDIVLWPVALDFKYESIRKMKKGEIALSILHGSVRNSEQEEMAKLLREKSQLVLAFGACACFGGTAGLANFISKKDIFDWVYQDAPTVVNPNNNRPQTETKVNGNKLTLPEFFRPGLSPPRYHPCRLLPARMPPATGTHSKRGLRRPRRQASSARRDTRTYQASVRHMSTEQIQAAQDGDIGVQEDTRD